ncbi:MAG: preprotein translocase subunit SecE [Candidatus Omnitrophota bacterium]|nr:preprotein translocase subunit SecE [Candidatus Omnitrophota bacterium]RKY34035.1 MAG: preprotein translocase subunit SecE [Candidatus Omnitrophota bacterium]RKY45702.1 MAG: preprotein translocase subunit SecE [Candidatus Omnitrophota bacterium]
MKKFPRFLKEVREELKKVNWSSREELITATVVVIIASVILTLYIAGIDAILTKIIQGFFK